MKFLCSSLITLVVVFISSGARADIVDHGWSQGFGDANTQNAAGVATDAQGNVIVVGRFEGTMDVGGAPLVSAGSFDVFVAKFDLDGNHVWSQRFGDGNSQEAQWVAVDPAGNVVVVGLFSGQVNFGGGLLTSAGGSDIFLAKFDSNGGHLWIKRFGDSNNQYRNSVAVDAQANVLIAGHFWGTIDFGGGPLTSNAQDIYVAKFSPDGSHLWSQRFGGSDFQEAYAITVDTQGYAIVTGIFWESVDFGGGQLTSAGWADIFLVKFDPDGSHVWSQRFGDAYSEEACCVAADEYGNVVATGWFEDTVDFGGGTLTSAGGEDVFLVKFDALGSHVWSKRFGHFNSQTGRAVSANSVGDVILAGSFLDRVDLGGGELTSAGSPDIFLAKFDADGDHLWSRGFGDWDNQAVCAVAVVSLPKIPSDQ